MPSGSHPFGSVTTMDEPFALVHCMMSGLMKKALRQYVAISIPHDKRPHWL